MILGLDHIVILAKDLAQVSDSYRAQGYTVTPGGEHADGLTHNALVPFQDGSYLELVAFTKPDQTQHFFYRGDDREGMITYALLPGDIALDVERARVRALNVDGPTPGGRVRPDGQRISWQTARLGSPDLPFLCADITPRSLRVPQGEAAKHANGALGIGSVTIVVSDLLASVARYRAMLDMEPLPGDLEATGYAGSAFFEVGTSQIVLVQPYKGPMYSHLQAYGDGAYSVEMVRA